MPKIAPDMLTKRKLNTFHEANLYSWQLIIFAASDMISVTWESHAL